MIHAGKMFADGKAGAADARQEFENVLIGDVIAAEQRPAARKLFAERLRVEGGGPVKIANFLKRITLGNHDPAIFCHWAGVRFLLDSQRSKVCRISWVGPVSR